GQSLCPLISAGLILMQSIGIKCCVMNVKLIPTMASSGAYLKAPEFVLMRSIRPKLVIKRLLTLSLREKDNGANASPIGVFIGVLLIHKARRRGSTLRAMIRRCQRYL